MFSNLIGIKKLEPVIEIEGLTKRYSSFTALSNCWMKVNRGEVFGLLGPNGAGKSTLIRLMLGFLNPTSGSATIAGFNCSRQRDRVHQVVSYIPGDARLFRMMRGHKILKLFAEFRGQDKASINDRLARGLEIADRLELDLNRWVGLMSTGMRQKLALVVCFMAETPVLILDEPTANLDPTVRGEVIRLVAAARENHQTVLFSSHVLSEIEDVCDRVAILKSGELVHQAPMSEIKSQHRIRATLDGVLPPLPESIAQQIRVQQFDNRVQIDTAEELKEVLKWLADAPLAGIQVQQIGLRSVYDRYHRSSADDASTQTDSFFTETTAK